MRNSSEERVTRGDMAVEALLQKAAPRPAPPGEDERAVRDAVYAEWQTVTGRLKTRRRMTHFAIAATVLLGVAVSYNALRIADVQAIQVATISKSHGSIYLLGEQSEQREITDLAAISAGQVILTGDGAGIGLEWGNGGSLRVDENTRIEFTSGQSVFLRSGQIYFDSQTEVMAAITGSGLQIETSHGSVRHLGTQYMTFVDSDELIVSVREGRVSVVGNFMDKAVAVAGKQLTIVGGAGPSVLDIDGFGAAWNWIEATAPIANVDGRTVDEFLTWVGRETGLQTSYESAAAQQTAQNGVLRGNVDMDPRSELAFRMSGEDLSYHIDGGIIHVQSVDSGSRP